VLAIVAISEMLIAEAPVRSAMLPVDVKERGGCAARRRAMPSPSSVREAREMRPLRGPEGESGR
jgi:hypothetical protein